jgi:hypothetical protein
VIDPVALIRQAFRFDTMEIAKAAFEADGGCVILRH